MARATRANFPGGAWAIRYSPFLPERLTGDVSFSVPKAPETKEPPPEWRRKYYVDGHSFEIVAHLVYELDDKGKQLRVVKYTDYTAETVRTLYPTAAELRKSWERSDERNEIIDRLAERGIDFEQLASATNQPDADPFDLLCHVAYNAPLRTRRERADRLRKDEKDFFGQVSEVF